MIYFMQPVGGGPVKSGFSDDVSRRHAELQAHYGQSLTILAVIDGDRRTEREIHEQFSHLRFGRTEQFRPAPDLMEFIGCPLLVDANPDAVEAMRPTGQITLINLKGTDAQAEWLGGIHRKTHIAKSVIMRLALSEWAERHGHPTFPMGDEDQ